MRISIVIAALAIIYLRTPTTFTNPQFWGEDIIFFDESRQLGWASLTVAVAGWLAGVQFIVACLASYFSPILIPVIYNYAAVALTLLVVWIITSPRLDLPYKPLLAIAVVVVPMAHEELGTLTNSQWILPIGAVALMFMRPAKPPMNLGAEILFVALTALSGPFAIFLAPMYLLRLITSTNADERLRFVAFFITSSVGAVAQVVCLFLNPAILTSVSPVSFSWTVWINLPFTQWMTTFGPVSAIFQGTPGVAAGCTLLFLAAMFASQRPYRTQKVFMLFFALAIVASGMYKFRIALATQFSSHRYFYFGSVFALWFICCLSSRRYLSSALATCVALTELMLLPIVANTPRVTRDLEWPVWARYLSSGLPTLIPSSPDRFYLASPATVTGPLAHFAPWMGRKLSELDTRIDTSACAGVTEPVEVLPLFFVQHSRAPKPPETSWITKGSAWDIVRNRPVQLIALVSRTGQVVGFGFPGFKPEVQSTFQQHGSGWISIFSADPEQAVRIYGVVDDGQRICPLANEHYFPLDVQALTSERFVAGVEILPGKEVVQRFKPIQRLEGVALSLVTWGKRPSAYFIDWRITARIKGRDVELGAGKIDGGNITDWQQTTLPLSIVPDEVPDQIEVAFQTDTTAPPAAPVGLPLYQPASHNAASVILVGGQADPSGGVLALKLSYAKGPQR